MKSNFYMRSAAEEKVLELVREGLPLKEARRKVYYRNGVTVSLMPKDLPKRLREEREKGGWGRSKSISNCGVTEGAVYKWAKKHPELKTALEEFKQDRRTYFRGVANGF